MLNNLSYSENRCQFIGYFQLDVGFRLLAEEPIHIWVKYDVRTKLTPK